jgi:hypothetical protein
MKMVRRYKDRLRSLPYEGNCPKHDTKYDTVVAGDTVLWKMGI